MPHIPRRTPRTAPPKPRPPVPVKTQPQAEEAPQRGQDAKDGNQMVPSVDMFADVPVEKVIKQLFGREAVRDESTGQYRFQA